MWRWMSVVAAFAVSVAMADDIRVAQIGVKAPAAQTLTKVLTEKGFTVVDYSRDGSYDALVVADAFEASNDDMKTAISWIRAGKPALVIGAPLGDFRRPVVPVMQWPLPKCAKWSFDHGSHGDATGTLTETADGYHITFSPMKDWSVFTSSRGLKVFHPEADALVFSARAAESATDMQIELRDIHENRWFAVLRMEKEWKRYAFYPEDFAQARSGKMPRFPEIDCIAFALSPRTPLMNERPADFELKEIGSAKDPNAAARQRPAYQDALYPRWKFSEETDRWVPAPRASGQGAFRHLRWRLKELGPAEWLFLEREPNYPERAFVLTGWKSAAKRYDRASLALAADALKRLVERSVLYCAGTHRMAYHAGETIEVGAEWRGAKPPETLSAEITDPTGATLWHDAPVYLDGSTNLWKRTLKAPKTPGTYRVRVNFEDDEITHEFSVMRETCDPKEDFIVVKDGGFRLRGKPWYPVGINYVPRYRAGLEPKDYRDAWLDDYLYNPTVVDADLAQIAALGTTFVAIQAPPDIAWRRNLVDFLRLARKHGLHVNLFVHSLCPVDFRTSVWQTLATDCGLMNDSTIFTYDVAWEYGFKVFDTKNRLGARAKDWEAWILDEYGSIAAAEKAWGCAAWRDAKGKITGPQQHCLSDDGPWLKQTVDYRRFMDDYTSRKWNAARQAIKALDPNHLITYRQGNTVPHDFTFTGPMRHLDFVAPEGYMVTDTQHGEDVIAWVTRYATATSGGKPVVWMEFSYNAWDDLTKTAPLREQQKAAAFVARFYRAGLLSGAAGMTPWWWPGGYRCDEISDYGMVEPTGKERPVVQTFKKYVAPYARERAPYVPDTWMDFDRDAHAGGYWRAALHEGAEAFRKAREGGRRLGIRLAGEGTDSSTAERRFLRAEFDTLDVERRCDGVRVTVQVGNPGMATWLPTAAKKGGVSIAVRTADGTLVKRLPLAAKVVRFGDSGKIVETLALPPSFTGALTFRVEAEGHGAFGEKRTITVAAAPAKTASGVRKVEVLDDGWKFMREESPGQLRFLSQPRILKWLDFMGRDLLELPFPCLTPEKGAPSLLVKNFKPDLKEDAWQDVTVPHDWGVDYAFLPDMPYLDAYLDITGAGWYRRHFTKSPKAGERVFFECDGAMSHAMVWINGTFVGGWPYGYTPWRVELTPYLKAKGDNVLAVRCYVFKDASRWYTGGGLYRECRLVTEADDHIIPGSVQITTPSVTKAEATVNVMWEMTRGGKKSKSFKVAQPRLWDVDDPYLYTLTLEGQTFKYGIRTIGFYPDDRGFQLNGRRVQIRGMCLHHDLGAIGTAFNVSAARRRLEKLRACGCNAIRMSHNEPDPKLLDLCDEMGFLVMDEVFDVWSIAKNFNDYATLYERWWERDLRRWIRTDRNHPSVIIWGFGNEIMESRMNDEERVLFKKLAAEMIRIVHQEDNTRPATTANDNPTNGFNGYADIVDIYGFNYRPTHYAKFHAAYPDKPVFGSETVCQLSTRGEYYFPVNFKRAAPIYGFPYFDYHGCSYGWVTERTPDQEWEVQEATPCVMGDFAWTGFDYLAGTYSSPQLRRHPQSVDPATQKRQEEEVVIYGSVRGGMHTCPTGLFDMPGFEKDEFYLYQSKWRPDLKMCHILPHWNWPEREGKNVPVYVYSTGDEVELFVNGRSQGRRRREPGLWRFVWNDVVYHAGVLKAVAYRKGVVWSEATVETTGNAARLAVEPEKPTLAADGKELGFVTVRVCDAKGRTVPRTRTPVKITVEGAGEFVAADNGDESDFTAFRSKERKAFNGLLSVIVRAKKGVPGEMRVTVTAPGLASATTTLNVTRP